MHGVRKSVALIVSLGITAAHAQHMPACMSHADGTCTLAELIDTALQITPRHAQAREAARQAHLAVDVIRGDYAPQVSIKMLGGIEHTPLAIPRNVVPRGYFVSSTREVLPTLQLTWQLFDFGRRKGRIDEASQTAQAADDAVDAEQDKLVFDVTKAYLDAIAARGKVRAAEAALTAAQTTDAAVTDQRQHGRATVVQVAQAHRQVAAAQVGRTQAEGDAATAFATLLATIGLPPETHVQLAMPLDTANEDVLPSLQAMIDEAVATRPDLRAARDKVAAAQAKIATAHAQFHPTIGIQAQVFQNIGQLSSDGGPYSSVNRTGNAVFLAFNMPLLDGGVRSAGVAIANSQRDEAEDALAAARDAAAQQVTETYHRLQASLANRVDAGRYVTAARLAYDASLDAYQHGLSTVTELTADEAALAQALSAQEDADAAVLVARAALSLATGRRRSD